MINRNSFNTHCEVNCLMNDVITANPNWFDYATSIQTHPITLDTACLSQFLWWQYSMDVTSAQVPWLLHKYPKLISGGMAKEPWGVRWYTVHSGNPWDSIFTVGTCLERTTVKNCKNPSIRGKILALGVSVSYEVLKIAILKSKSHIF
jgi:hypothetical protein